MITHVFEAMVDVVLAVDLEGRVTLANSVAQTLTGFTEAELLATPIATLLTDDGSGVRTAVRKRIEEGDILRREDSWLVTKAGARIPVSVTAAPILDTAGQPTGIVLVLRDTSEIRKLLHERDHEIARREIAERELRNTMASIEDRLEQTRSQLLLAERRATLGTLAGGVGHELRNIAQLQVTALEILRDELRNFPPNESIAESLDDLNTVNEHITVHARRLLQYAKPGPDHASVLDVGQVVRDVVAMLRGGGQLRSVEMTLDLEPASVTVNKTRIEQILVNLLVNAADAIGNTGGTITIGARTDLARERAIIFVRDTGSGIPADVLPRIFEPFFTTKPEDVGTGLGLPVVREIVESYDGCITVESTVGTGTTFTFDLPLTSR